MSTKTIAYGMSDMAPTEGRPARRVRLPEHRGGCGKEHAVKLSEEGRAILECAHCAPVLIGEHYGWASSAAGVPLTPDEQGEVEMSEREGRTAMRMAMSSLGETVGRAIQDQVGGGKLAVAPPAADRKLTAVDLFGQMSRDERAEFARLLAADAAPAKPEIEAPAPELAVPVKRGPGRPRKTT